MGYARKRAIEEAAVKGEVEMKDVADGSGKRKDGVGDGGKGEGMDVDVVE